MLYSFTRLDAIENFYNYIGDVFGIISDAADVVTEPIANFYDTVVNFLTSIYNYLVTFATRGLEILQFTALYQTVFYTVFSVIWTPIGICAAVIIGIGAIKLIAGWGNT